MKHPAFIFVLTKKGGSYGFCLAEARKAQCPRQFPDDCYSGIVPALWAVHWCILQKRSGKIIP